MVNASSSHATASASPAPDEGGVHTYTLPKKCSEHEMISKSLCFDGITAKGILGSVMVAYQIDISYFQSLPEGIRKSKLLLGISFLPASQSPFCKIGA